MQCYCSFDRVMHEILQNVGLERFQYRMSLNVLNVVVENGINNRHLTQSVGGTIKNKLSVVNRGLGFTLRNIFH